MGRVLHAEGLVPVAGLIAFLLVFGVFGGAQDPAPQALWVGAGLLLAPALMAYAHRWAAAWAAIFGALAWTSLSGPYVAVAVVWAYAAVSVIVAQGDRPRPGEPVPRRRPPPAVLPKVARASEAAGAILIALAALGLGYVWSDVRAAPLLTPVIGGAGLGCALLARAVHRQHALRDLFEVAQVTHAVRVVEQLGYLHVLLPSADGQTALEFGFDVAEPDEPDDDDDPHTVPAVLYGDPRPGAWCAAEVSGRLHVPLGPVGDVITVPYDVVDGLPREIEDDEEQLVDPAALRAADAGGDAYRTREHRIAPQRAWTATVTIGLGAALGAGELGRLLVPAGDARAALVAVAAALGYEFGWRNQLRPRLRWHAGGIAAAGFRGVDRQPWATDSAVLHDDRGSVLLTAGEAVLTVPAPPPWPATAGQRTADELVAALRVARTRSLEISPLEPPPEIPVPRRPLAIYPIWLLTVALTMAITGS